MEATSTETSRVAPPRGWPLFLAGIVVFFLGPVLYAIEMGTGRLALPWYLLVCTTVGVLLMLVSVVRRRGIFRGIGSIVFALLCGAFWYFLLVVSKTPQYAGPAQPGKEVPPFSIVLADGRTFQDSDLKAGQKSVLLFFRGRW
jgi:hypothetical protein